MPPKKMENYINDVDLTRLIAKDTGITIKAVAEMREAQSEIIKMLLRKGKVVSLGELGKFSLKDHKAQAAREFLRPYDGKVVWLDEKPEYQTPQFKFIPSIYDTIKKATTEKSVKHG